LTVILKPATLFAFHKSLVRRKYRQLFASTKRGRPGPKGPSAELIAAVLEMKRRNPRFDCPRIALEITHAFGIDTDKDIVRRILEKHYQSNPGNNGPSWLSVIAQARESLWSVDLFRCESVGLKSYWVMVVIDVFTRRIVGLGVEPADIDGIRICRMFNRAIAGHPPPQHLSSDNDTLFRYHRWRANLRILEIDEIKSVPYTPTSHSFLEQLIGTIRREYLDQNFFWGQRDLARKLDKFKHYYNEFRVHSSLAAMTPQEQAVQIEKSHVDLTNFNWMTHCKGLFQTPIAV
jgi:hypothetical protein